MGGDFVPGQKLAALNGEFVPGAWVQSEEGVQFLPGCFNTNSSEGSNDLIHLSPQSDNFIAGQFIEQVIIFQNKWATKYFNNPNGHYLRIEKFALFSVH